MKKIFLILLAFTFVQCNSQNNVLNKEEQINAALQAAPKNKRAEATVLGYTKNGEVVTLKKGTNELICLSDNPKNKSYSVACYHKDLEPFMTRGRALKAAGKNRTEIFDIREKEAKNGKLKMPTHPSTLYILYGGNAHYDINLKKIVDANYRYVVYIPWATSKSTGLPTKPQVEGGPWIMDPGTHKAHIMISPSPIN